MYIPTHFEEANRDRLYDFIRCNPFATLVTNTPMGLSADHLPVYLNTENSERICLQGHIATKNPLWKNISDLQDTLLIFQGTNAYITPHWYPSKKIDGKVVPTWNYSAVHIKGKIEFFHEPSWKLNLLNHLTDHQEQNFAQPWRVSDAPADFIEKLLSAIVGFEVVVNEIYGKCKLSQNQNEDNKKGVIQGLREQEHPMAMQIENL